MATGGLTRWFNEKWVDLSRPKDGGGYEPCGRADAHSGHYPKCVPASRAARMTPEEIKSAIRRKRRAESTQTREDKKPIMVETVKKIDVPADMELYNRVKAEAKKKFDVYPSAYANGWLVQEYKRRGGKYKTVSKGDYVGHPFRGNQWTGKGVGLSNQSVVRTGWMGEDRHASGIYGVTSSAEHPDEVVVSEEPDRFAGATEARLDTVSGVLHESHVKNRAMDKSVVEHLLSLNNAAQDVFLSHVVGDRSTKAVENALKATMKPAREIRRFNPLPNIQGARIKVKTQARKDLEVDTLNEAEYKRYSKAPSFFSHDSAMAYAMFPKKFVATFGDLSTMSKMDIDKGDFVGHPFRGNQWTGIGRGLTNAAKIPNSGGQKTQKQKDAEVDSLNELEYHLYSKAPSQMKHDEAIAHAKSPEGQAKIDPEGAFGGSIDVGDFMPKIVKPIKVKSEFDRSVTEEVDVSNFLNIKGKSNTTRGIYTQESRYIKAARQQNSIEWLEIKSKKISGSGKEKFSEFTMSDGSKIIVHHNNKAFIWSPETA